MSSCFLRRSGSEQFRLLVTIPTSEVLNLFFGGGIGDPLQSPLQNSLFYIHSYATHSLLVIHSTHFWVATHMVENLCCVLLPYMLASLFSCAFEKRMEGKGL